MCTENVFSGFCFYKSCREGAKSELQKRQREKKNWQVASYGTDSKGAPSDCTRRGTEKYLCLFTLWASPTLTPRQPTNNNNKKKASWAKMKYAINEPEMQARKKILFSWVAVLWAFWLERKITFRLHSFVVASGKDTSLSLPRNYVRSCDSLYFCPVADCHVNRRDPLALLNIRKQKVFFFPLRCDKNKIQFVRRVDWTSPRAIFAGRHLSTQTWATTEMLTSAKLRQRSET